MISISPIRTGFPIWVGGASGGGGGLEIGESREGGLDIGGLGGSRDPFPNREVPTELRHVKTAGRDYPKLVEVAEGLITPGGPGL